VFGPREIEDYVRDHLVEIAEEQFPDNVGLRWTLHRFQHREDLGLVLAEVEPDPSEVGYPRFQFAFRTSGGGPPKHIATYCLDGGVFTLLSTSGWGARGVPRQL
jgi:hypothetical protein